LGYADTTFYYPVLYLLHGLFGSFDNWATLTGLAKYAADHQLILVMPEGGDGWYTDSETNAVNKFESYLIKELIPEIDANYRTINERRGRGIAGLSMGGYGALKFGLKYPQSFKMTASISGAFDPAEQSDGNRGFDWSNLRASILQAFGDVDSKTRAENDLYKLAARLTPADLENLPSMYFDCGLGDEFLSANRKLSETFSRAGIVHEFCELPGEHDWNFWDQRVQHILKLAGETLVRPEP
jgi:S-formylglutathione hydrolase FrmB